MQKKQSNLMECTYCNKRIEASPLCSPCINDGDLPAFAAVEGGTAISSLCVCPAGICLESA